MSTTVVWRVISLSTRAVGDLDSERTEVFAKSGDIPKKQPNQARGTRSLHVFRQVVDENAFLGRHAGGLGAGEVKRPRGFDVADFEGEDKTIERREERGELVAESCRVEIVGVRAEHERVTVPLESDDQRDDRFVEPEDIGPSGGELFVRDLQVDQRAKLARERPGADPSALVTLDQGGEPDLPYAFENRLTRDPKSSPEGLAGAAIVEMGDHVAEVKDQGRSSHRVAAPSRWFSPSPNPDPPTPSTEARSRQTRGSTRGE